ncbi:MAG: protein kinase [Pirellulales bacterium]
MLHRDLKPANVLLTAEGMPKLADFNVSFCSKVAGVTPATFFGGSLAYMSLEQLEACDPQSARLPDDLDSRSDVYALAIVLWELLSGTRPFPDASSKGGMTTILPELIGIRRKGVDPVTVKKLPSNLPTGLTDVLLQCLSPEPERRPNKAAFVGRLLELCLRPRAQNILRPTGRSMASRFRNYPLSWYLILALLPNIGLSVFNVEFNVRTVIEKFVSWEQFVRGGIIPVNSIMYPPGIAAGLLLAWPVVREVARRAIDPQAAESSMTPERLRTRCLGLPLWMAVITFILWTASGFVLSWLMGRELCPRGKNFPLTRRCICACRKRCSDCCARRRFFSTSRFCRSAGCTPRWPITATCRWASWPV